VVVTNDDGKALRSATPYYKLPMLPSTRRGGALRSGTSLIRTTRLGLMN
jgi:hypothetical protein